MHKEQKWKHIDSKENEKGDLGKRQLGGGKNLSDSNLPSPKITLSYVKIRFLDREGFESLRKEYQSRKPVWWGE